MREVLQLLQDGEFHSGEAIGRLLGVSRAAVWKRLQCLDAELELSIQRVRGRGYRLPSPLCLLRQDELQRDCAAAGWSLRLLESVDSTNAEALRGLSAGAPAPLLVLAERQEGGRGRRGRAWVSPYGENLYYSLGLRLEGGLSRLDGLSLVVGLAVMRSLQAVHVDGLGLKWPNDVLLGGQKIAGILLELVGDPADSCQVVIGVGVNVNMLPIGGGAIDQPWTSLRLVVGSMLDRTQLALSLGGWLRHYLGVHAQDGFSSLREEWEAAHLWQGREVSLLAGPQRIDGVVLGVDRQGSLRLEVDGRECLFSGGELSLRLRDDS